MATVRSMACVMSVQPLLAMALRSTTHFCSRPSLRRRFPDFSTALTIKRSKFSSCLRTSTRKDFPVVSSSSSPSPRVFTRAEQLGALFRPARAGSSFNEQGVLEESGATTSNSGRLILYSKPGCCLCDGLKEKLVGNESVADFQLELISTGGNSSSPYWLSFQLDLKSNYQVRDITTNSEWWNFYQYEIPVLTRLRGDGTEERLPRLSPRLSAEQVQKKIHALMTSIV